MFAKKFCNKKKVAKLARVKKWQQSGRRRHVSGRENRVAATRTDECARSDVTGTRDGDSR